MKKIIINSGALIFSAITVCLLFITVSCDNDALYENEKYKNVIYLLSGSENVYTESYTLNETEPVKYFSIGIGGSHSNPEAVTVQLEPDRVLFDQYNKSNFDVKYTSYAKLLSADRYTIDSYTIEIPANPTDQYVKVPVKVRPLGLSPDTIYFIPLAIKSVSKYEVNDEKYNILYRVTIQNDYAKQTPVTYYVKKGTVKDLSSNSETTLSGSKIVQPLTKDKVRMFVGNYTQSQTSTPYDIETNAITVQIKSNNTLAYEAFGTIEVELIEEADYNRYAIVLQGTKEQRCFFLHYKYRIMNDSGAYGAWNEVRETLTRVEED